MFAVQQEPSDAVEDHCFLGLRLRDTVLEMGLELPHGPVDADGRLAQQVLALLVGDDISCVVIVCLSEFAILGSTMY